MELLDQCPDEGSKRRGSEVDIDDPSLRGGQRLEVVVQMLKGRNF